MIFVNTFIQFPVGRKVIQFLIQIIYATLQISDCVMDSRDIGERIRQIRKQRGITQQELAEKIDVSFQQVQKYETGQTNLTVNRLIHLADALEISPELLFRKEPGFLSSDPHPGYGPGNTVLFRLNKEEVNLFKLLRKVKKKKVYDHLIRFLKAMLDDDH